MTAPKHTNSQREASFRAEPEETVVPIAQEELHIEKQKVETGRVRLTKNGAGARGAGPRALHAGGHSD